MGKDKKQMSKAELSEEELNFQLKKLSMKFEFQDKYKDLSNEEKAKLLLNAPTDNLSDLEIDVLKELLDFYMMMIDFDERGIDITEGLPE